MKRTPDKSSKMIKPIEESSYLGGLKKIDNSLKPLPRWGIIIVYKNFKGRKAKGREELFNLIRRQYTVIVTNDGKGIFVKLYLMIWKLIWRVPEGYHIFKDGQGLCIVVTYKNLLKSLHWKSLPLTHGRILCLRNLLGHRGSRFDYSDTHLLNSMYLKDNFPGIKMVENLKPHSYQWRFKYMIAQSYHLGYRRYLFIRLTNISWIPTRNQVEC